MNKEFVVEAVKHTISALTIYDYLAFAVVALVFLVMIFMGIAIKKIAPLTILLGFFAVLPSPLYVPYALDELVYKTKVDINESKKLQFSDTAIISGSYTNLSNLEYKECKIYARLCKKGANPVKQAANCLKPLKHQIKTLTEHLAPNDSANYMLIIDEFTSKSAFVPELYVRCR